MPCISLACVAPPPPLQDPHSVQYSSIIPVFDSLVLCELDRDDHTLNLCYELSI